MVYVDDHGLYLMQLTERSETKERRHKNPVKKENVVGVERSLQLFGFIVIGCNGAVWALLGLRSTSTSLLFGSILKFDWYWTQPEWATAISRVSNCFHSLERAPKNEWMNQWMDDWCVIDDGPTAMEIRHEEWTKVRVDATKSCLILLIRSRRMEISPAEICVELLKRISGCVRVISISWADSFIFHI